MNNPWNFQKDWLSQTAAKNRQSYPVENDRKDVTGLIKISTIWSILFWNAFWMFAYAVPITQKADESVALKHIL